MSPLNIYIYKHCGFNVIVKGTDMGDRKMGFHADEVYQDNIKFSLPESLSITIHKLKNINLHRHCKINSMMPMGYLEIVEKELFRFN